MTYCPDLPYHPNNYMSCADPCPSHQPYPHRREERLAAAITRSRDARQQNYMRNRDEFVASAITSAFASDREKEREATGLRASVLSVFYNVL